MSVHTFTYHLYSITYHLVFGLHAQVMNKFIRFACVRISTTHETQTCLLLFVYVSMFINICANHESRQARNHFIRAGMLPRSLLSLKTNTCYFHMGRWWQQCHRGVAWAVLGAQPVWCLAKRYTGSDKYNKYSTPPSKPIGNTLSGPDT